MKTRTRQQQEIDWLKEKIQLLERIVELERQLNSLKQPAAPIYPNPFQPVQPWRPWDPYQPTITFWKDNTSTQVIAVKDQCQTFIATSN